MQVRGLSGLSLSPDGRDAVLRIDRQDIDTNQTLLEWRIVRLSDGWSKQIADGGAPRWTNNGYLADEAPQWSPDGMWIYFRRVEKDGAQIWRVDRDGSRLEQVTRDAADVQAFIIDPGGGVNYAVSPATRAEIIAAENIERDEGVLLDNTIIKGFPVTRGFPVNGRMATYRLAPGSTTGNRSTLLGDAPLRAMSLGKDGRTEPAGEDLARRFDDLWVASRGGAFPIDPERAGRATSTISGRFATLEPAASAPGETRPASRSNLFLLWRREDGAAATCLAPACLEADQIAVLGWTGDGRTLVFRTRTFGTMRLNVWAMPEGAVRTVFETDGVLGSYDSGTSGECQLARREAVCIAAASDAPPRLVAIDIDTGEERVLLDPNPHLTPDRLGVAGRITLSDRFGNAAIGRVILPPSRRPEERLPLVITSYTCGGFLLGGSGRDVPEHVLAGLGYAAVCVDFGGGAVRRTADYVPTQSNGDLSALDFFESAVRILDQQAIIDPGRVLLTGFSGSATATAFALTRSKTFTAAAVTTEGSLDAIACHLTSHTRSCANLAEREGYSRPYDGRSGILRNSPAWNVENISAPLLMQLPEVEYASMMQLYGAMLDYGRAVEMYIFAEAYHYKNRPRQRLSVYRRNVDWANFWLRGIESDAPDRGAQNARWEALRENQCRLFAAEAVAGHWYCGS